MNSYIKTLNKPNRNYQSYIYYLCGMLIIACVAVSLFMQDYKTSSLSDSISIRGSWRFRQSQIMKIDSLVQSLYLTEQNTIFKKNTEAGDSKNLEYLQKENAQIRELFAAVKAPQVRNPPYQDDPDIIAQIEAAESAYINMSETARKFFANKYSSTPQIANQILQDYAHTTDLLHRIYQRLETQLQRVRWLELEQLKRLDNLSRASSAIIILIVIAVMIYSDILMRKLRKSNAARNEYATELEGAKKKAEQASQMKSEFLANMSHELRNPLGAVIGTVDLLRDTELNDDQKELADIVVLASNNLLEIINDILDLAKIEEGRLELTSEAYSLRELLQEIFASYYGRALAKNLRLILNVTENMPHNIIGDRLRLQQILTNLIGNAVKFTRRGSVTINVDAEKNDDKYELTFEVIDTGIGIAKDKQKSIFDKFIQADSSTTHKYGGTGLGLAISRNLVELMGGTLELASEVGQGSKFWFTITCAAAPTNIVTESDTAYARLQAQPAATNLPHPTSILIVEDIPVNQTICRKMLQGVADTIDIATDGVEAVTMVKGHHYDLILMDCMMPNMNGYDATRAIRQLPAEQNTIIIAITANAMKEERQKCLDCGMDDYISKPMSKAALVEVVQKWLVRF